MRHKTRWPWKVYFFFSLFAASSSIIGMLYMDSPAAQYYKILMILNQRYWMHYSLYQSTIALEALSIIPLFLFVFHKKFLNPWVWQILFCLRILFLFLGHSYEWMMIKSYIHSNATLAIASITIVAMLLFPSFLAHFLYAFQQKKIFPKD